MTATAERVRQWYRDPVSCVQTTLATLLLHAGADPLEALGLGWEFRFIPGDIRPEEYYLPCRFPGDIAGSLMPYHDASSSWRSAVAADPVSDLEAALDEGTWPIVAVDNYHLPFRPAYHDVHAAHLIVVYGIDRKRATAEVSDAMPPAFAGSMPLADLLRAWLSGNPQDGQDVFFSGRPTGGRWLHVTFGETPQRLEPDRLDGALAANIAGFTGAGVTGPGAVGLDGFDVFSSWVREAARSGRGHELAMAYTFGWPMQAQAALHGELLRRLGGSWKRPLLAEAGRRVERVAHLWTAVRVHAAHRHRDLRGCERPLARHLDRLRNAYNEAVEALASAGEEAKCG